MEKLKSLIPDDIKRLIATSTQESLPQSCSALLDFLLPSPQFQKLIGELANADSGLFHKSAEMALGFKKEGNECFSKGDYSKALSFYSKALRFAPTADKDMMATLYVNRASTTHKLEFFKECKGDCIRAIDFSPHYAKAWYRKGKANVSLQFFEDAIQDFEAALRMNCSIAEQRHIKEEAENASNLFKRRSTTSQYKTEIDNSNSYSHDAEQCQIQLQCVFSEVKGKGLAAPCDILPATLIHSEGPFSAVVQKSCRETHCHYCLSELPVDIVFCPLCAIPAYCSKFCQEKAGFEHRHECQGVNWSAVLPSDVVLTARVMAKIVATRGLDVFSDQNETSDFVHGYIKASPEGKLDCHLYSVVLACCFHSHFLNKFQIDGTFVSQLVILLFQIKVNSMAITRVNSAICDSAEQPDMHYAVKNAFTCNLEQVRVGLAIYLRGRLFNHSCRPNAHAYFISRNLFIRSTEFIPAGCPVEISYGPQVGQYDYQERQKILEDQYSFKCQCNPCTELHLSDVIIHAFHCSRYECLGVVLKDDMMNHVNMDMISHSANTSKALKKIEAIDEVAPLLLENRKRNQLAPGSCFRCGSSQDIEILTKQAEKIMANIKEFRDDMMNIDDPKSMISSALMHLDRLKHVKHPFSKDVSQLEDLVAQAFCLVGELDSSLKHCKASLKILQRLYPKNHIAIGYELVKLASLQLSVRNHVSGGRSIEELEAIFLLHFGSHATRVFPYLGRLKKQCEQMVC